MKHAVMCLTLMVCIILFGQTGFTVAPPRYELLEKPGNNKTVIFTVENKSDNSLHIRVSLSDWSMDSTGEVVFHPSGTFSNSSSEWVYINPMEFDIDGNASRDIRITLSVPEDVFGEYRSMAMFKSTPSVNNPGDMVQFSTRIGAALYTQIVGTVSLNGSIEDIVFNNASQFINVKYLNTGNAHHRADIKIIIKNSDGNVIYEDGLSRQLALPSLERVFIFKPETYFKEGDYRIEVLIDYGGNEMLRGIKNITVYQ